MEIKDLYQQLLRKVRRHQAPLPAPGLYQYLQQSGAGRTRIHLRVETDGSGTLHLNAGRVLHLNASGAAMTYLMLEKTPDQVAVEQLTRGLRVTAAAAGRDYTQFCADLLEILRSPDACPVCNLDLEVSTPFSTRPSAPYRMDLALTYRCNDDCAHCYNARPRNYPEMPANQWKLVIDRLWDIGIPHVVFTGGEPTLRNDLPELVAYAAAKGQITGLNTNARRLSDGQFLSRLVDAGLEHVQITVESHDPQIHDQMVRVRGAWKQTITGLNNALDTPLFVMTNTTMLRENSPTLRETLDFLAGLGVPTVGLNALIYSGRGTTVGTGLAESHLAPLLEMARERTSVHDQRLIWYTPTQYCHFDPMQLELGVKGCTAALYNMCVEPDGGVLPCQSYYRQTGNILKDPWSSIWGHPICLWLRERRYTPDKCNGCLLLAECGGGCPLVLEAQRRSLIPLGDL